MFGALALELALMGLECICVSRHGSMNETCRIQ